MLLNNKYELNIPDYRIEQWQCGWEERRISHMLSEVRSTDFVYDIGAETGDISALLAQRCKDILLVEPSPNMWKSISNIWQMNNLDDYFSFPGFASDKTDLNKKVDDMWVEGQYDPDVGFRHLDEESDVTPEVRLDDLADELGYPDFLTIDVEGSEYKVLSGAKKCLKKARVVYLSYHHERISKYGDTMGGILDLMSDYNSEVIDYDHELHIYFRKK